MSKYIGSRIVPKHCGTWSKTKDYEVLSLVLFSSSGDSYISRKAVPAGTDISDTEYWALSSEYSAQLKSLLNEVSAVGSSVETLKAQVAANVSASTDEDADYAAEVVDARVGYDSTAYESLGEAVRGQAGNADTAAEYLSRYRSSRSYSDVCVVSSTRIDYEDGSRKSAEAVSATYLLDVAGFEVMHLANCHDGSDSEEGLAFYDADGEFLSGISHTDIDAAGHIVEIPDGASYAAVTLDNACLGRCHIRVFGDLVELVTEKVTESSVETETPYFIGYSSGNMIEHTSYNYRATDYLPCGGYNNLVLNHICYRYKDLSGMVFYDEDKNFISGKQFLAYVDSYHLEIPENAAYFRTTLYNTTKNFSYEYPNDGNTEPVLYAKASTLLNIRAGNSLDAEKVALIRKGEIAEVLEVCDNGWYRIKCEKAECGYAYVCNTIGTYFSVGRSLYTVQPADSLWKIAEKELGSGTKYTEIKTANGLTSNVIRVGMVLLIP